MMSEKNLRLRNNRRIFHTNSIFNFFPSAFAIASRVFILGAHTPLSIRLMFGCLIPESSDNSFCERFFHFLPCGTPPVTVEKRWYKTIVFLKIHQLSSSLFFLRVVSSNTTTVTRETSTIIIGMIYSLAS